MKPLDLLNALRTKSEKAKQEIAVSIVSIARKQLDGRDCSKAEADLLQNGQISEMELTAAVETLRRFDAKVVNVVAVERKFRDRVPKVKSATERIPQLERELAELRQVAAGGAWPPDYGALLAIVSENKALFAEFVKNDQPDPQAIRGYVAKLADEPVVHTAA